MSRLEAATLACIAATVLGLVLQSVSLQGRVYRLEHPVTVAYR